MVHINDKTVNTKFQVPSGGMGASDNGGRFGGPANVHEFTQSQWISALDHSRPPIHSELIKTSGDICITRTRMHPRPR